ncbi:unnamed protein product [Cyclocybe aegerita]|uniref:NF-kappa-B-activating protein C-terminal domain-containing protein n=1 Tax=Cyclocybe aegerita TaxID=1973307 RepID=A0A8S0WWU0_CYCAE|nr:unnamed protein product [Cyclocybe aegerita]
MATVHPSRMALIPQDMRETRNDRDRRRNRSPSPRRSRRSPSPRRNRSRERYMDGGRDGGRGRDSGYDRNRRNGRENSRERGRDDHRASEPRRASPEYDDYRRPPPPSGGDAPATWKPLDTYSIRPYYQGGGADFLEDRRIQRENRIVNPWPASPKEPARELSPKRSKKSSRKSKRQRSSSPSSSDDSEEERRCRDRKERKRAQRKQKEERRDKKRSRHHEEDDREDDRERHHRHRSQSRSKSALPVSLSPSPSPSRSASPARMVVDKHAHPSTKKSRHSSKVDDDDSGDEVGPKPIVVKNTTKKIDERAYGGALLRGEGSAMAAFLQDGTETRIPRRGEIGLTSDEIAQFEDVGYVMSGSRHRRMNAVRMRKENQVISAEEKRGILKLQKEEKARREAILREEFSELVNERLKASSSQAPPK